MKYFFDTEFIEDFYKPLFGKNRHFIDLISIAIVAEDGRTYTAISNEYNYYNADEWVKKNVILPLYLSTVHGDNRNRFDVHNFHFYYGNTNFIIAEQIRMFVHMPIIKDWDDNISFSEQIIDYAYSHGETTVHEFYGYYSDYDWTLFCSLFGRMIDLPKGFPMYSRDLKQSLDEKLIAKKMEDYTDIPLPAYAGKTLKTLDEKLDCIKKYSNYPKQKNEHSALADAKWNFELYKFITNL